MLDWFRGRYGLTTNVPIFGPWEGHLDNSGERVALYMPDTPEVPPSPVAGFVPQVLVEEVHYSALPPWPVGADSTGNSLQRLGSGTFANEPANWQAATPTAGSLNQAALAVDTDHDGLPDEWELLCGLDPNDPSSANGPLGDPDNDGLNNLQEYLAGTDPHNSQDTLRFDRVSCSNRVCRLQFNTHTGRTYVVERLDRFQFTNAWTALTNCTPNANGPVTVSDAQSAVSRFYRLRVRLNP